MAQAGDDILLAAMQGVSLATREGSTLFASVLARAPSPHLSSASCARAQALALAMAQHPRLGAESPAAKTSPDCMARIFEELQQMRPIVLDAGSDTCRAGFAGDDVPSVCFPLVIGKSKIPHIMDLTTNAPHHYVGDAALAKRQVLRLQWPVDHGIVASFEALEVAWRHTFLELCGGQSSGGQWNPVAAPLISRRAVLLTDAPLNHLPHRERLMQLMFDCFDVPAVGMCNTAVLALYASGRTTGVVVDIGHTTTFVVPVYEGHVLTHAIRKHEVGGLDLTDYLQRLLNENRGCNLVTSADREKVRRCKEQCAYVAMDMEEEMRHAEETFEQLFALSDEQMITIGYERFRCAEVLLFPTILGRERLSLHDQVHNAIVKADAQIRPQLYGNVVLTGGSSVLPGLAERLTEELILLAPAHTTVHVEAPQTREHTHAAWRGGSALASLPAFQALWITREEYEAHGPAVVHKKCS